jgi:arylsulfatase A-like enzyme
MPTFINLLGINPATEPKWDGQDIWPLLTGENQNPDSREIYLNFRAGSGFAVRDGDWKLISSEIEGTNERTFELFNMAEDPYEQNDLASTNKAKVDELADKINKQFAGDYVDIRKDLDRYSRQPGGDLYLDQDGRSPRLQPN